MNGFTSGADSSRMLYGFTTILGKRYYLSNSDLRFIQSLEQIGQSTHDLGVVDAVFEAIRNDEYGALSVVSSQLSNIAYSKGKDAVKNVIKTMGIPEVASTLMRVYGGDYSVVRGLCNLATKNEADLVTRVCSSMNNLYERDPTIAKMIGRYASSMVDIFGDKYEGILDYVERRGDRDSILAIDRIVEKTKVADAIKNISMSNFGNKQAKRLIKLASHLDYVYQFGLEPIIPEDLHIAFNNVENTLKNYIEELGIGDLEKAMRFIPWVKTKDQTALSVLRGDDVEKAGISRTYPLVNMDGTFNLEDIRKEIQSYASTLGLDIFVEEGDLLYLKRVAESIMSEIDRKRNIKQDILGEIKPNLGRILNLAYNGTRSYELSVNPSDLESQMESLQSITSCMSPGGSNFRYTQTYLANPNTFWAVIKDAETGKVAGDVTVFMGKHKGKRAIARVSKVYSHVPVSGEAVDEALKKYASEINAKFIESGEMFVEGLEKAAEDFAKGDNGKVVVNKKQIMW